MSDDSSRVESLPRSAPLRTVRRGLALSPELRLGLAGTLGLAVVAMLGRAAVPVAIQQGIDRGLRVAGGPDVGLIAVVVGVTVIILCITTVSAIYMMRRLFTVSETALASLRTRTFRHIHDLSMLHQQAQRRGSLTSRVTSDVDQITQFLQWGGVILLVSCGQIVVTTGVMLAYSWRLTLVVYAAFLPLIAVIRYFQRRLAAAYGAVRVRVGAMLGAVSESVVGAEVIRAYGVSQRSAARLDQTINDHRDAQFRALRTAVIPFSAGELASGLALASVAVVGVLLGVDGRMSVGELTAFLFLVAMFVQPVQIATEVLNEAQNAVSGWQRILDVLDLQPEVVDPGEAGRTLPPGPIAVHFDAVSFAYPAPEDADAEAATAGSIPPAKVAQPMASVAAPGMVAPRAVAPRAVAPRAATSGVAAPGRTVASGQPAAAVGPPRVLSGVAVTVAPRSRVAVVGETGSGKTTFAKLLTRMMDPTEGEILLSGVSLREVNFASLRRRVLLVAQDGFLFDATIAGNVRFGRPDLSDLDIEVAFGRLGLRDWLDSLPAGVATPVGERGEALSVGERQLVALVRAYVADPDLLVLDEATSSVDPATEQRLQRALDEVTRGRTTVAIAHRLSTAESADEVLVFDRGVIVQRGSHAQLVNEAGSVYARLHEAWLAQTR